MSNKGEACRASGKPTIIIGRVFGQRHGKQMTAAAHEVFDEMTAYPPATKEEAQAFLRVQAKRCKMNLANAKNRNDNRAQANLTRKLAVYEYLERVVAEYQKVSQPNEATKECPECKVVAVDIFGHCHCCGRNW